MIDAEYHALLLTRLGEQDGGRVDPARILQRPPGSTSRQAFLEAQDQGWLDAEGWVTAKGREALEQEAPKECVTDEFSSRVCQRGTKCCEVDHGD